MNRGVFDAAWTTLIYGCNYKQVKLDKECRNDFVSRCNILYKAVAKNYMTSAPESKLDRHKIGSIIAIIGADEKYYPDYITLNNNQIDPTRFHMPIEVALNMIESEINKDLKQSKCSDEEVTLYVPKAAVCTTNYISSIGRIMYLEEQNHIPDTIRVLELANTFFLLEECALIKSNIDMDKWVNFKRNQYKH